MSKYVYLVVDSGNVYQSLDFSRQVARVSKKACEEYPLDSKPPFKILRLDLTKGEVVR